MIKTAISFLKLPESKQKQVTGVLLDACYLYEGGQDWKKPFKQGRNSSLGKVQKIYKKLLKMNGAEFEEFLIKLTR